MVLYFFILFSSLMTQAPDPIVSVELTLQTRGVHKSIRVTRQQTDVDINGRHRQQATRPAQWQALLNALRGVDLSSIASLPTDVSRSAVDAALSARVRVATATHTYESVTYDHPTPPARLTPAVRALIGSAPKSTQTEFR